MTSYSLWVHTDKALLTNIKLLRNLIGSLLFRIEIQNRCIMYSAYRSLYNHQVHVHICSIYCSLALNWLNSLRKRDEMLGKPRILSLFLNSFNKFNKTWALMKDPIFLYHYLHLHLRSVCSDMNLIVHIHKPLCISNGEIGKCIYLLHNFCIGMSECSTQALGTLHFGLFS